LDGSFGAHAHVHHSKVCPRPARNELDNLTMILTRTAIVAAKLVQRCVVNVVTGGARYIAIVSDLLCTKIT